MPRRRSRGLLAIKVRKFPTLSELEDAVQDEHRPKPPPAPPPAPPPPPQKPPRPRKERIHAIAQAMATVLKQPQFAPLLARFRTEAMSRLPTPGRVTRERIQRLLTAREEDVETGIQDLFIEFSVEVSDIGGEAPHYFDEEEGILDVSRSSKVAQDAMRQVLNQIHHGEFDQSASADGASVAAA